MYKGAYWSRFHYIQTAPIEVLESDSSVTEEELEVRKLTDEFEKRMNQITPVACMCKPGDTECFCNY